jgi:hypothetical protein
MNDTPKTHALFALNSGAVLGVEAAKALLASVIEMDGGRHKTHYEIPESAIRAAGLSVEAWRERLPEPLGRDNDIVLRFNSENEQHVNLMAVLQIIASGAYQRAVSDRRAPEGKQTTSIAEELLSKRADGDTRAITESEARQLLGQCQKASSPQAGQQFFVPESEILSLGLNLESWNRYGQIALWAGIKSYELPEALGEEFLDELEKIAGNKWQDRVLKTSARANTHSSLKIA